MYHRQVVPFEKTDFCTAKIIVFEFLQLTSKILEKILELSFQDEESYVSWDVDHKNDFTNVSFEFRTRSRETQVMALEFQQPSLILLFGVILSFVSLGD